MRRRILCGPPAEPEELNTAAGTRSRWLIAGAALWALVVVVAAFVSSGRDGPTAREQTSVDDARPAVDAAVAALVTAAGPAVLAVSPFTRAGTCRISAARDGEQWRQEVTAYVTPGTENVVVDRIARGLPSSYRATTRKQRLKADAGDFVGISGGPANPGEVRITVATGCRTGTARTVQAEPDPAIRRPVTAAFDALDVTPVRWEAFDVPCPDGGAVHVGRAESDSGTVPGPLPATLMTVGPGAAVAGPEVYAYRAGDVSVVARVRDGVVSVEATTGCR